MMILPVLDLLDGQVVRGVAGQRSEYRRIVSRLTPSSDPLVVANAIRDSFGFVQFYVADLDAIVHRQPNLDLYRRLIADGFPLLVDAGVREPGDALLIQKAGEIGVVVGLETCRTPDDLSRIADLIPDVTFSLDLLNGLPRRSVDACGWSDRSNEIIQQIAQANVNSIIVLDLSDVGMGMGGSTDKICQFIRHELPMVHLIAGGGVRGRVDLNRFDALGVDAVLVASALHDGCLVRDDFYVT